MRYPAKAKEREEPRDGPAGGEDTTQGHRKRRVTQTVDRCCHERRCRYRSMDARHGNLLVPWPRAEGFHMKKVNSTIKVTITINLASCLWPVATLIAWWFT